MTVIYRCPGLVVEATMTGGLIFSGNAALSRDEVLALRAAMDRWERGEPARAHLAEHARLSGATADEG